MLDAELTLLRGQRANLENDTDVLVFRAAAQQKHIGALQCIEEGDFGPTRVPAQHMLMTIGSDDNLLARTDPVFDQHIRRKSGNGRDPACVPSDQRQQCAISQTEGTRVTFRVDERIRIVNTHDVISHEYRTEISKAQYPGSGIQGQNELIPFMARPEACLANADS